MYSYTEFDRAYLDQRIAEFRAQTQRRIDGVLTEEEFKPFRLQNGLYLQLHAYMLRIAIPYGTLNSRQMFALADIAERFDKGYGHFTTRQNIQFNWVKLVDVADILTALAKVDMHAIQTSGNCIRNVTADHFAGAAADEIEDPRLTAELLRQWSTGHPEYAFLPRKFKIAVTGCPTDRAVIAFHDIGLQLVRRAPPSNEMPQEMPDETADEIGYKIFIGGGLGRTPRLGRPLYDFVKKADLLLYLDSIMAVYNRLGRRDNKYKSRIKILIDALGSDAARAMIDKEFHLRQATTPPPNLQQIEAIRSAFAPPDFSADFSANSSSAPPHNLDHDRQISPAFSAWLDQNTSPHKNPHHSIVTISLKPHGKPPGDASAAQMRLIAELAKTYAYDDIRVSHEQNIILPHVPHVHLRALYDRLAASDLATANIGLASDMITCPGLDYCSLATARSIPIAQDLALHVQNRQKEQDIGPLKIKISGCINACGHHHIGHIGILGLDRAGVENYQITLGGEGADAPSIGTHTGPGFDAANLMGAIDKILDFYLSDRTDSAETFLDFYRRVGMPPFKAVLYGEAAA